MGEQSDIQALFVHLARIALSGKNQDASTFLRRIIKRTDDAELASQLRELLRSQPTRSSALRRRAETPLPVDTDSRFHLLRVEENPEIPHQPIFSKPISRKLSRIVQERRQEQALLAQDLEPTRSALFVGPPGVGKTLAARWLAMSLGRPLLVLDLSAVMSSYLGRTGANLRHVFDYAKSHECVLLLDELDAIAKRRADQVEIGELKRLVTVLLQQLDDWPSDGLLIAATNHAELLDPALWRRFEEILEFDLPDLESARVFIRQLLKKYVPNSDQLSEIISLALMGSSFAWLDYSDRDRQRAMDAVALFREEETRDELGIGVIRDEGNTFTDQIPSLIQADKLSKSDRVKLAVRLVSLGLASQRAAYEITGVSRDTIRKNLAPN